MSQEFESYARQSLARLEESALLVSKGIGGEEFLNNKNIYWQINYCRQILERIHTTLKIIAIIAFLALVTAWSS